MKKIVAAVLVVVSTLGLVACSGQGQAPVDNTTNRQ